MLKKNNNKTALVFGATGLVGNELTEQLLSDDHYSTVKIFVRKNTGLQHPRLSQVIDKLDKPEEIANEISGDDIFCCLGTTIKKAGSKEAFERVDLYLPLEVSEIAARNSVSKCIVVSSIGADADSGNFYLRTKGKMEQRILSMNFESIGIVRPSILLGKRKESRIGESFGKIFIAIFSVFLIGSLRKYRGIQARTVAKAMIKLANSENFHGVVESDKLQELGLN